MVRPPSLAGMAAIRGFHWAMLEQAGEWDTVMGELARESPLLGLPAPH